MRFDIDNPRILPFSIFLTMAKCISEGGIRLPDTIHASIRKDELAALPLFRYDGPVHVIRDDAAMAGAVKQLGREKVLGFDTETRPTFRRGQNYLPSVVQLASADEVYVIQLKHITNHGLLAVLLSRRGLIKTGIALDRDLIELRQLFSFQDHDILDLSPLAAGLGFTQTGLRNLAGLLLGVRISKQAQVTNWSADQLTDAQVHYAAADAWISRQLYLALKEMETRGLKAMPPPHPEPAPDMVPEQ